MSDDDKTIEFNADDDTGATVDFSEDGKEDPVVTMNDEPDETDEQKELREQNLAPPKDDEQTQKEEMEKYGDNVKKRISTVTAARRNAEDERDESLRVSKAIHEENVKLKAQLSNLDAGYLSEYSTRLDSEEEFATEALEQAIENSDAKGQVTAQKVLSRVAVERDRHKSAKQRSDQARVVMEQESKEIKDTSPKQDTTPPAKPDPRAEKWAEDRPWFGEHEGMTFTALSISKKLITDEGVDPNSDEYYTKLNERMGEQFPTQLGEKPKKKKTPSDDTYVAPAGDSASSKKRGGKRSVKLTASQVAIARKLNVPLSEYAKYVK